jgi:hypothetical protein
LAGDIEFSAIYEREALQIYSKSLESDLTLNFKELDRAKEWFFCIDLAKQRRILSGVLNLGTSSKKAITSHVSKSVNMIIS